MNMIIILGKLIYYVINTTIWW